MQDAITSAYNLICIRLLPNKPLLIPLLSCFFLAAAFCFLVGFQNLPLTITYEWDSSLMVQFPLTLETCMLFTK